MVRRVGVRWKGEETVRLGERDRKNVSIVMGGKGKERLVA